MKKELTLHYNKQIKIQEQYCEALISKKLKFSALRFKRFCEVILLLYNSEDLSLHFADRRIVMQAKAKMNRRISEEAKKHLNAWAKKNGLTISPFL